MSNNAVILAGGQGKRMKTNKPKVLCSVIGEPMLEWVLTACENADINDICVVKGYESAQIDKFLEERSSRAEVSSVLQEEQLGTGHAVMQAREFWRSIRTGIRWCCAATPRLLTLIR